MESGGGGERSPSKKRATLTELDIPGASTDGIRFSHCTAEAVVTMPGCANEGEKIRSS